MVVSFSEFHISTCTIGQTRRLMENWEASKQYLLVFKIAVQPVSGDAYNHQRGCLSVIGSLSTYVREQRTATGS